MKDEILCPRCQEHGRRPKVLAKYENVVARQGYIELWCKACRRSVRIELRDINLDR